MEQPNNKDELFAHFQGSPGARSLMEVWSAGDRDLFASLVRSVHAAGLDWWYVNVPHELARFGRYNPQNEVASRVDGVIHGGATCGVSFRHGFADQQTGKQQLNAALLLEIEKSLVERVDPTDATNSGLWPEDFSKPENFRSGAPRGLAAGTSVRELLQEILNSYTDARLHSSFGGHAIGNTMQRLAAALRSLRSVAGRDHLVVEGSIGKGNWARVPWVALRDSRETPSTQRGVYAVLLFREDMTGVYVTFNQGVTEPTNRLGRAHARDELASRAKDIRLRSPGLGVAGFQLDERIDLRASGSLGRGYEASTIAYKFYASGQIPSDQQINDDVEVLLQAYDGYIARRSAPTQDTARTWLFQANPQLYRLADAVAELPFLTFEVRQHASDVREGDSVFLWQSGPQSGVIARATVTADPRITGLPGVELAFANDVERFRTSALRVDLKVESHLAHPLLRRELLSVPALREASIIRGPQGTNFRLTNEEAETLAEMYKAALSGQPAVYPRLDLSAVVDAFSSALAESGLRFSLDTVRSFVSSLATKRFVILTGLSGSGKTQLALRFGQWCGPERVRVIPIRPDWTGPEYLLGYEDALLPTEGGRRAWSAPEALQFMLEAAADPQYPYVLVLDEMNLAHVERYFADVLSGMESDQPCLPNLGSEDGYWRLVDEEVPRVRLPDNLFIVGTVNVDETTFMFSPKVLDRANTIEFRIHSSDLTSAPSRPKALAAGPDELIRGFLEIARDPEYHHLRPTPHIDLYEAALRSLHEILAEGGFEFGHRTFYEAARFASLLSAAGDSSWQTALDLQLMQKMLPRIHGSRRRLETMIGKLQQFCSGTDSFSGARGAALFPRALARVQRLERNLMANQFAGFIE